MDGDRLLKMQLAQQEFYDLINLHDCTKEELVEILETRLDEVRVKPEIRKALAAYTRKRDKNKVWLRDYEARGIIRLADIFINNSLLDLVIIPCFGVLVPGKLRDDGQDTTVFASEHFDWTVIRSSNVHEKTRCFPCAKLYYALYKLQNM